jgi:hypothetical protein
VSPYFSWVVTRPIRAASSRLISVPDESLWSFCSFMRPVRLSPRFGSILDPESWVRAVHRDSDDLATRHSNVRIVDVWQRVRLPRVTVSALPAAGRLPQLGHDDGYHLTTERSAATKVRHWARRHTWRIDLAGREEA